MARRLSDELDLILRIGTREAQDDDEPTWQEGHRLVSSWEIQRALLDELGVSYNYYVQERTEQVVLRMIDPIEEALRFPSKNRAEQASQVVDALLDDTSLQDNMALAKLFGRDRSRIESRICDINKAVRRSVREAVLPLVEEMLIRWAKAGNFELKSRQRTPRERRIDLRDAALPAYVPPGRV